VSTPRHCVLAPPGHANPPHRRPRRSPPNHRAARCRRPRLAVPPNAAVYAHELCRAAVHALVRPHHAFPGHLPCTDEVVAAAHACRTTAPSCALAPTPRAHSRRPSWARPWAARAVLAEVAGALCRPAAPGLCHWAAEGFGPVAFDYIFIFSEYI
jgi:hypothetical protein